MIRYPIRFLSTSERAPQTFVSYRDISRSRTYWPSVCWQRGGCNARKAIREEYPEVDVPISAVRKFKESYSYVGDESGARVKVPVDGKPRKIEIGKQIGLACNQLLGEIFDSIKEVIAKASPQSVFGMLQNIVLTGGGSRIRNIDQELQRLLVDDGYEEPDVRISSREVMPFVGIGALKVAKAAREDQWIRP